MNFELSEEQHQFAESAARYVRDRCSIESKRAHSHTPDGFSHQHWANFADMGWLALMLPEAADGLAGGIDDLAVLMEQLGHGLLHEPIVDSPILCGQLLAQCAHNTAATDVLKAIGSGTAIVALAHSEANGHCEYSSEINTSAIKTASGWCLSGTKCRVFYGTQAHYLLISAQLDDELAWFLSATNGAGLSADSYSMIDASPAADIKIDQLHLTETALLLHGEAACAALHASLDMATLADCARALGSMAAVMHSTADYLKTRVQYGKPLAQFQALQHRMSEMLVEYEQAQSIVYRALSLYDDPAQRPQAVSAAKVLVSQSARWVTAQAIQLHGGIGVTEEYSVAHHYKAMLSLEQRFGDSEFHLDRCASSLDA